jgi:hypothetical protein
VRPSPNDPNFFGRSELVRIIRSRSENCSGGLKLTTNVSRKLRLILTAWTQDRSLRRTTHDCSHRSGQESQEHDVVRAVVAFEKLREQGRKM